MDTPNPPQPPELEIEPAGEANTTVSATQPISDAVELSQTEAVQPPPEPIPTPETPQIEPTSELIQTPPETPTPHLPVDEALPETTPEPTPQGANLIHADVVGQEAPAEATKVETPTPLSAPSPDVSPSEETPPQAEESPRTPLETPAQPQETPQPEQPQTPQAQQGTPQPEPEPTPTPALPASPPESLPAPATPIPTPPQNILMLLLTKAHLVTQLRKQKKLIKVMGLFATKKSITNDDVEKLLHVSDATALRYLTQLKKENKIIQIGKTGQGVSYTKY